MMYDEVHDVPGFSIPYDKIYKVFYSLNRNFGSLGAVWVLFFFCFKSKIENVCFLDTHFNDLCNLAHSHLDQ